MGERFLEPKAEDLATLRSEGLSTDLADALLHRRKSVSAIRQMTAAEIFDEYCMWHGLIGWGGSLRGAYENSRSYARRSQGGE